MANNRILEEITIVNDFKSDDGRGFISAEELIWSLPNGRNGVFEPGSGEYIVVSVISEEDFGEGVEVTGEGLGLIEVFGLVDDKTDNTNA
jgi:hypothetical protein